MKLLLLSLSLLLSSPALSAEGQPQPQQPQPQQPLPLSLEALLARVKSVDPLIRQRAFERMQAQIDVRRAQWNRVSGNLGVNGGYGLSKSGILPSKPLPPDIDTFFDRLSVNVGAQVNVPLFAGFSITAAIEGAKARLQAATYSQDLSDRDAKQSALTAYVTLIASYRQLEIAQAALTRAQALLSLVEKRKAAGINSQADVARARLNLLTRDEDVSRLTDECEIAQIVLRAALVMAEETPIVPTTSLEAIAAYAPSSAAGERLELSLAQSQIKSAEADYRIARAGYFPRIEVYGSLNYGNGSTLSAGGLPVTSGGGTERFGFFGGNAGLGLRLAWTGFDFFVTRDTVARAEQSVNIARTQAQLQSRNLNRERAQGLAREQQALHRLSVLSNGGKMAQEVIHLTRAAYEAGSANLTEVLNAELEAVGIESRLLQARSDLANTHLERLRSEGVRL